MGQSSIDFLADKMDEQSHAKLAAIDNSKLHDFVKDAVELCEPDTVWVSDDSEEDIGKTRNQALELGEERKLGIEGHTIHYDGMFDQGRDRQATKYLVPEGDSLSKALNQIEREEGLEEVRGFLKGSMKGRTMIVRFMTLGPNKSDFSIPSCSESSLQNRI
jgi:phosphoenolpyruvate carboxykinase (GTP)